MDTPRWTHRNTEWVCECVWFNVPLDT